MNGEPVGIYTAWMYGVGEDELAALRNTLNWANVVEVKVIRNCMWACDRLGNPNPDPHCRAFDRFMDTLRLCTSLETLVFYGQGGRRGGNYYNLREIEFRKLAAVLPHLTKLRVLDLRWNSFLDDGMRAFLPALPQLPNLEYLDLGNNPSITDNCGLFRVLQSCTRLRTLKLKDGCHQSIDIPTSDLSLTKLELYRSHRTEALANEYVHWITAILYRCPLLEELDLNYLLSGPRPERLIGFANALRTCTSLTSLGLNNYEFDEEFDDIDDRDKLRPIFEVLPQLPSLRTLQISGNEYNYVSVQLLQDVLPRCTSLTTLDISFQEYDWDNTPPFVVIQNPDDDPEQNDWMQFAVAEDTNRHPLHNLLRQILRNCPIEILNLSGLQLGVNPYYGQQIFIMLAHCPSLRRLNVSNNFIIEEYQQMIRESMEGVEIVF